jgi:hypothetical protein
MSCVNVNFVLPDEHMLYVSCNKTLVRARVVELRTGRYTDGLALVLARVLRCLTIHLTATEMRFYLNNGHPVGFCLNFPQAVADVPYYSSPGDGYR